VPVDELIALFARLDELLVPALRAMQEGGGEADPVLGAYISERQVERLMAVAPGTSPLRRIPCERLDGRLPGPVRPGSRLGRLRDAFGLDDTDLGLVVVAAAPEFDGRYERLYAYLQDDATQRWPSVGLALDLISGSAGAMLKARRRLTAAEAPLLRHRLVRMHRSEPGQSLLSCRLSLDPQAVDFLFGHDGLDERLTAFAELMAAEPRASPADQRETRLLALAGAADQRRLLLHFHGDQGAGKRTAAGRLATMAGLPLLCVDLARAPADDAGFDAAMSLLAARCRLHPCLLYLGNGDAIPDAPEGTRWRAVAAVFAAQRDVTVLASREPLAAVRRGSVPAVEVAFDAPTVAERRWLWRERLARVGLSAGDHELDSLAELFELTPGRIGDAVSAAAGAVAWRAASGEADGGDGQALFLAARAQAGEVLAGLADRLEQAWGWDDIVLPGEALAQLRDICRRVIHKRQVLDGWGMGRKLPLGRGVAALFAGPSGTGKTMAAAIVGRELGLDVYRIDLSRVVNKYIGETEKNLARVFDAAERANVILLFDEAEALFGKRSEIKDAHDRYANIEIGYLLQRMDAYPGATILATNLRHHLDEAFLRRLQVVVPFPMPAEADRLRLWRKMFPREAPLAADVDFEALAREVRLSGGNVRNIALAAAFAVAGEERPIGIADLWLAAAREHRKLGRPWHREGAAT
jgi:AAA+ superfamily predicted ATPase